MITDNTIKNIIFDNLINNTPEELMNLYSVVQINDIDNLNIINIVELESEIKIEASANINLLLLSDIKDDNPNELAVPFNFKVTLDESNNIIDKDYQLDLSKFCE